MRPKRVTVRPKQYILEWLGAGVIEDLRIITIN